MMKIIVQLTEYHDFV